ncbi:hypothetical protein PVAP13_5KG463500 [Panicum virgatum]|uniref:Uncharacterized protein n=1 Tax=Panicum virgatum TaxID=38727 RepID=A0A8T0SQ51_PANVG|nr:hypothetical protein PVAP13_5KG463500 [Panicum virgatum]
MPGPQKRTEGSTVMMRQPKGTSESEHFAAHAAQPTRACPGPLSSAPAVSGLRPPREGTRRPKPDRRAHPKTDRRAHAHKRPPPCLLPKPTASECLPRLTPAVPVARGRRRFSFPSLPCLHRRQSTSACPKSPTLRQIRTRQLALKYSPLAGGGAPEQHEVDAVPPTSQSYEAPRSRDFQRAASRYRRGAPPCRVQMVAEEASHCSRRRS